MMMMKKCIYNESVKSTGNTLTYAVSEEEKLGKGRGIGRSGKGRKGWQESSKKCYPIVSREGPQLGH